MKPEYVWTQISPPEDWHPGTIEEGWYVVRGDSVTLTDRDGRPIGHSRKLEPGEDPKRVAVALLRARQDPQDAFWRPIAYPRRPLV